jgi:mRNA (guanine-N7-)-methyltransferase
MAAAIPSHQIEEARRREEEREAGTVPRRDVSDFVKQHYNAVPERGREWRRTDSKIKGLRSYNNWVKSVVIQKCGPKEPGAKVLDIGCGKGGDLMKWQNARIGLYVGVDPADVSVEQAKERYMQMVRKNRRLFRAEFIARDGFGMSLQGVPAIMDVGFDAGLDVRWGGGGFDTVTMMFSMHYAFETEEKAKMMLQNVAGALKKGGHFIGVIPNSDVLSAKVRDHEEGAVSFGNDIYQVTFPEGNTPKDGVFRPPFGWKYLYKLEEAVDAPEFVVPWEAFRGLAEDFNLQLEYRKPFSEVFEEERHEFEKLGERMGVIDRSGRLMITSQEMEAANFYHAFSFCKA